MSILGDIMQSYSTAQVATAIGVSKKTLLRWLWTGKLAEPKQTVGSIETRIWTEADLTRAKRHRERHYRKRS
jgi:predicted site-specific integrase-resolvase